jgi:hypothetical protein
VRSLREGVLCSRLAAVIGVDRYQAADIGFLTSAVRDATALHALFTDGFQGSPVLLTDAGATRAKIVEELERLAATSSDDDLVVDQQPAEPAKR